MKVGILAGGLGSRLSQETETRPKPMVEIGGKPILWHIMKHFARHGFETFAIALGYKGNAIREYFSLFDHRPWQVDLVETGMHTQTGGRIKRLAPFLGDGTFMMAWGDGVSDLDLRELLAFHRQHGRLATVAAVRPPARYGKLTMEGDRVIRFAEKPQLEEGWINGGFFVLEPGVFSYVEDDDTQWELEPMARLTEEGQLMAYRHEGYWQCMDTMREKHMLCRLWDGGAPPWKTWA